MECTFNISATPFPGGLTKARGPSACHSLHKYSIGTEFEGSTFTFSPGWYWKAPAGKVQRFCLLGWAGGLGLSRG